MTKNELNQKSEDDVIPLEIAGSIKLYNQAYVDKQEKRIAELEAQIEKKKFINNQLNVQLMQLEKENAELKKNYEDSLVACAVLKEKIDIISQPSPVEAMQDTLITTQKIAYEKTKKQLTKAKEIIREYMNWADWKGSNCPSFASICKKAEAFLKE